ncbi:hypothetical protein FB45DRAFT_924794 [Roridomyces roridus]|uniref:Cryptic loci regulator 2 N-terminal domain-containing protein n=1 Tax=Roridomyces roridus TaxID=1738132 RepID=A0AAD7FJ50_9AGAR|nr:hypothetical protein FB45DRAFT_924794 [Roridomyces roridus]
MSTHRNHSNKHALPDNPVYLDFPRSDGDAALWPINTTRIVDEEGCVNFMHPVALDEPLAIKWRVGVGDALSSQLSGLDKKRPHVLTGWPDGYRMFDHHKGKQDSPRHDVYLFGSDSRCRFRSVPEFIPHAMWLMGDPNDPCKCKYCSKKPQREITSALGLRQSPSPSPSRAPVRPKTEKPPKKLSRLGERLNNPPKPVHASVQKTEVLQPQPSPHVQTKHVMLVERSNHLREAVRSLQSGAQPRWFRDGELVWVALPTEIMGPGGIAIQYWPSIIEEARMVKETTPIADSDSATPWVTRQYTTYRVLFLAISKTFTVPDTRVIPYQSHSAMRDILEMLANRPVDDWSDFTAEKRAAFDPCCDPPPSFISALTPFGTALQTASNFSTHWCLTDEWEARIPSPAAALRPAPPPSSIQSAIEMAGSHNANMGSISSGPGPAKSPFVSQTRFQGIWWGGERIWADDLVRLKIPRSCLAPSGAQHIFSPSGPGPKSRPLVSGGGVDDYGVGKRECRIAGQLFELADADWEDPNLPRDASAASSGTKHPDLPHPPTGYKFRSILAPGYETLDATIPVLLQHPLIRPYVNDIIPNQEVIQASSHLWALEGVYGGYKNAIDPQKYKGNREKMMTDAIDDAFTALRDHITHRRHLQDEPAEEMDVDA